MTSFIVVQGIIVVISVLLYHLFFRRESGLRLPLPPGPKPVPILGNIRDLPPPDVPEFQHWLAFKDRYGPIISVTILGRTVVIVNDKEAAVELAEKNSQKTSSRPQVHFANMCGYDNMFTSMDYTDSHRRHRRFMHQQFRTKALVSRFHHVQDVESKRLLVQVIKDPQNLLQHIRTEAGAIILKIAHDYTIEPFGFDPLVKLIEDVMVNFSRSMSPLAYAVDLFPMLRHLPEWFPGAGFKRTAREWKAMNEASAYIPYNFVKKQMEMGAHQPSYISELIEARSQGDHSQVPPEEKKVIAWTAQTIFAGGSDTTVGTLRAFVLAMMLYPRVQQKAQEEIDRVIGPHRLPGFQDQIKLPYISALVKEMLRWFPVVPIVGRKTDSEVFVRGYRIPKNLYTFLHVWWFLHDPQTYADPMAFDPNRFLEPRSEPDPGAVFGFGRRICAGRFFAQDNLFITAARILAAFTISKSVDADGKPIDVQLTHSTGVIDHIQDFPCSISPRSEQYAEMIQRLEREHPWEEGNAASPEWGAFDRYKEQWERKQGRLNNESVDVEMEEVRMSMPGSNGLLSV